MTPTDEWDWELTERAERQLSGFDSQRRDRIIAKLDEVVSDEWGAPPDFLAPVGGSPYEKLRVGDVRLGCIVDRESEVLVVGSIRPRDGAYEGDD